VQLSRLKRELEEAQDEYARMLKELELLEDVKPEKDVSNYYHQIHS